MEVRQLMLKKKSKWIEMVKKLKKDKIVIKLYSKIYDLTIIITIGSHQEFYNLGVFYFY